MIVFEFMSTVCKMHNYKNNIIRRIKKLSLSFEFLRQRSLSQINKPRRSDEKHVFYDAQDIVFLWNIFDFHRKQVFYHTDLFFGAQTPFMYSHTSSHNMIQKWCQTPSAVLTFWNSVGHGSDSSTYLFPTQYTAA